MTIPESSPWTTTEHCERYSQLVRSHQTLLRTAWDDLEISSDDQILTIRDTALKAENVWREAHEHAENQRASVREQIDNALSRIRQLKGELSDETFTELEEPASGSCTLKGHLDKVQTELSKWLERRAVRQAKYESLKAEVEQLRQQLGLRGSSVPVKTVTLYVLEGLAMELQRLQSDQAERQKRLNSLLEKLRQQCILLGEDEGAMASEVHPSLGASRDAQSSGQDLSDRTFDALREKIIELQEIEAMRREKGRDLLNTLTSLWDALNVPEDDIDREIFGRMMDGQHSLYKSSHDKCIQEIERLKGAKKDMVMGIIETKRQQIIGICASSHMPVPTMPNADIQEPGEVADTLARVLKQHQAVHQESDNRQGVLAAINTLNRACEESDWLAEYEDDPLKYKGRDSTRKIQRAIAAGEMRKQLPQLIHEVALALEDYRDCSGRVFMFDDKDYQAEILPAFRAKLQEDEGRKLQGIKTRSTTTQKSQSKPPVTTPRRVSRLGGRTSGSGDGSVRKPGMPVTPRGDVHRGNNNLLRSTSSLSRTSSIASRLEAEAGSFHDKVARAYPGSPSVSRTSSGYFDIDREHVSHGRSTVGQPASKVRQDIDSVLNELSLVEASKENNRAAPVAPSVTKTPAASGKHARSGSM